jgi:hypothetical protein
MNLNDNRRDTREFFFRGVYKNVDLLATPEAITVFTPAPGEQWMLLAAFQRVRATEGVESDPADFQIDNGTDGQDIVATTTSVSAAENDVKRLTVTGNHVITQEKPLRLRITDAAGGLTEFKADFIFALMKISEIG